MGFDLGRYVTYRRDRRLLLASLCLSTATFAIYLQYFDILAPYIPQGSVRSNSGIFFGLPVFILLGGQTLFDTWFMHTSITLGAPDKRDALKAYFVASFQILLFSGYYVIFPYYGPYTYVVYFMPGESFGSLAYPILIAWTLAIIVGTYLLTEWAFRIENDSHFGRKRKLLLAAGALALILVMAS